MRKLGLIAITFSLLASGCYLGRGKTARKVIIVPMRIVNVVG